jgi:hypothetical protein
MGGFRLCPVETPQHDEVVKFGTSQRCTIVVRPLTATGTEDMGLPLRCEARSAYFADFGAVWSHGLVLAKTAVTASRRDENGPRTSPAAVTADTIPASM